MRLGVWAQTEIARVRNEAAEGVKSVRSSVGYALLVNEERRMLAKPPEPPPAPVIPITDRLRLVRGLLDKSKPPREPDE